MKRTPIVLTATVVGLIGVLEFHTRPVSAVAIPAAAGQAGTAPAGAAPSRASTGSAPPRSGSSSSSSSSSRSGSASRSGSGQTRTAVGPAVNYSWGVLSVRVTVSGTKITKVGIASLDDGGNPRSQFIDQQSIPVLEQETLQAQSSNIQGVSGASYTSAGFQQSLQAALGQLGLR